LGIISLGESKLCIVTYNDILSTNSPPTADAGNDQTVNEGSLVQLDGSNSSDPENNQLTYSWIKISGPGATLSDPNSPTPTFTAPNVGPKGKTIEFQLIVNDGIEDSIADLVQIEVLNN